MPTSVLIYGQFDRGRDSTPRSPANGLGTDPKIRVRRSLGSARPRRHARPGHDQEAARRVRVPVTGSGAVTGRRRLAWRRTSRHARAVSDGHPIAASATTRSRPTSPAALHEVVAAGLAGAIDVGNTNTYGGCFGPRFTPHRRHASRAPVAAHAGAGARHQHRRQLPGLRAADGLPRRADLPQARLRLGRQLPRPRRHALRVGRRAAQHVPVPVAVLPERAQRRHRVVRRERARRRADSRGDRCSPTMAGRSPATERR